jgi:hypothetical protein
MGWFSVWFFLLGMANLTFAQPTPRSSNTLTDADINRPVSKTGGVVGQELNRIYARGIGRGFTVSGQENIVGQANRIGINTIGLDRGAAPTQSSLGRNGNGRAPSFGVGMGRGQKPFSTVSSRPTVSPYMSLFVDTLNDAVLPNYTTFTRPQLQQQRFNDDMRMRNLEMERRVQSISAQSAFASPRGSESQHPTGHPAMFSNTGRYYPANLQRR